LWFEERVYIYIATMVGGFLMALLVYFAVLLVIAGLR
jgi:hypothetical protein